MSIGCLWCSAAACTRPGVVAPVTNNESGSIAPSAFTVTSPSYLTLTPVVPIGAVCSHQYNGPVPDAGQVCSESGVVPVAILQISPLVIAMPDALAIFVVPGVPVPPINWPVTTDVSITN